ncbi:hypothetical protein MtrunA17_Chr3g0135821 [Medicago truncatula]|uniref:Uncharacterized protein n=1 Tax=Medicago truncatula TaxID=3880 RepID=A0A396J5E3_MEDTR|nr:hypothetical protein MtrunA17_Chr3g0135821 [Medicago truncatula]
MMMDWNNQERREKRLLEKRVMNKMKKSDFFFQKLKKSEKHSDFFFEI